MGRCSGARFFANKKSSSSKQPQYQFDVPRSHVIGARINLFSTIYRCTLVHAGYSTLSCKATYLLAVGSVTRHLFHSLTLRRCRGPLSCYMLILHTKLCCHCYLRLRSRTAVSAAPDSSLFRGAILNSIFFYPLRRLIAQTGAASSSCASSSQSSRHRAAADIAADSLHFCEQGAEQIHVFASPASASMTCRHPNIVVAATNGLMPPAYCYVGCVSIQPKQKQRQPCCRSIITFSTCHLHVYRRRCYCRLQPTPTRFGQNFPQ